MTTTDDKPGRTRTPSGRGLIIKMWLPTIPYSLSDAVNRVAAATGSVPNAVAASTSSYNGHLVSVWWNDYKKFWLAEYHWGERVVLGRGSLEVCLEAGKAEFLRGARGTTVHANLRTEEEAEVAAAMGYKPWSKEIEAAHRATWSDDRYDRVGDALREEKNFGTPAVAILLQSSSAAEYDRNVRERGWKMRFGDVEKTLHLQKGDNVMQVVVFQEHVVFLINDKFHSEQVRDEHGRKFYREKLSGGWRPF